ncbi:uncharacterized protein [Leptinotarsa decemlineata]|uniref:uncharacterized protein n=1 Tax=Leptinotarsa decemlineata TaxID=7539 RepID=UPI003D306C9B
MSPSFIKMKIISEDIRLVLLVCSLISMSYASPIYPNENVETSVVVQGNTILNPLSDLNENLGNAVSSAAKAKTISFVPPFPDSGRTMAVQEQRYLETIPIKLDDKYGRLQEFIANFANPQPIVDTIQEHEKYGNDGGKLRAAGTAFVGGVEALSNVLNAAVELPFTAVKEFGRKVTTSLNTAGSKLVGLAR